MLRYYISCHPYYPLNFVFSDHLIFVVDKFSVYSAVTEGKSGANEAAFFLFRIDLGGDDHGIIVGEAVIFTVRFKNADLVGVASKQAGYSDPVKLLCPYSQLFFLDSERRIKRRVVGGDRHMANGDLVSEIVRKRFNALNKLRFRFSEMLENIESAVFGVIVPFVFAHV